MTGRSYLSIDPTSRRGGPALGLHTALKKVQEHGKFCLALEASGRGEGFRDKIYNSTRASQVVLFVSCSVMSDSL